MKFPEIKETTDSFAGGNPDVEISLANASMDNDMSIGLAVYRISGGSMVKYALACTVRTRYGVMIVDEIIQHRLLFMEHYMLFAGNPSPAEVAKRFKSSRELNTCVLLMFEMPDGGLHKVYVNKIPSVTIDQRIVKLERDVASLRRRLNARRGRANLRT
jgi:hypothetical protein